MSQTAPSHVLPTTPVRRFEGVPVRISSLAEDSDILEALEFVNCLILGPAVIGVLEGNTLRNCIFEGDLDAILWELPRSRTRVIGAIGIRNCVFRNSTFRRIGFAGPAELSVALRQGVTEIQPPTPSPPTGGPTSPPPSAPAPPERSAQ